MRISTIIGEGLMARLPLNADTGSMHLETVRTGLRIVSHIMMISEKWSVDPPSAGDARESPIIARRIDIALGCVIEIAIVKEDSV